MVAECMRAFARRHEKVTYAIQTRKIRLNFLLKIHVNVSCASSTKNGRRVVSYGKFCRGKQDRYEKF